MKSETKKVHLIDATGKKFGRIASEAAKALIGKTRVDYTPNILSKVVVEISNANELDIPEIKRRDIVYKRYSGFPGGQRVENLGALMDRRGVAIALRKTIEGMLPKNSMRKDRMKHLVIK